MKAITTQISWKKIFEVLVAILTAIVGALTSTAAAKAYRTTSKDARPCPHCPRPPGLRAFFIGIEILIFCAFFRNFVLRITKKAVPLPPKIKGNHYTLLLPAIVERIITH